MLTRESYCLLGIQASRPAFRACRARLAVREVRSIPCSTSLENGGSDHTLQQLCLHLQQHLCQCLSLMPTDGGWLVSCVHRINTVNLHKANDTPSYVERFQRRRRCLSHREIVDESHELSFLHIVLPQFRTVRSLEWRRRGKSTGDGYSGDGNWSLPSSMQGFTLHSFMGTYLQWQRVDATLVW